MRSLRRAFVVVLLLTVPFQAAWGATGLICGHGSHHSHASPTVDHHHDANTPAHFHPGLDDDGTDGDTHSLTSTGSLDGPGKCELCNECCFSAAPVPAPLPDFVPPDTLFKVSGHAGPAFVSRSADGLFRPPRTTTP